MFDQLPAAVTHFTKGPAHPGAETDSEALCALLEEEVCAVRERRSASTAGETMFFFFLLPPLLLFVFGLENVSLFPGRGNRISCHFDSSVLHFDSSQVFLFFFSV